MPRDENLKRKVDELEPHSVDSAMGSATRTETDEEQGEWEEHNAELEAPRVSSSPSSPSSSSSGRPLSLAPPPGSAEYEFTSQGSPRSPNSTKQAMLYAMLSQSIAPKAVEPQSCSTAYMKPELKTPSAERQGPKRGAWGVQTGTKRGPYKIRENKPSPEKKRQKNLDIDPAPMPMSIPGKLMLQNNHYAKTVEFSSRIAKSKRQLMAEQVLTQQKEHFAPALPPPPVPPKTYVRGACLCGAVSWEYEGDPPSATICNCTACRRYGALWAYSYIGDRITTNGPTKTFSRGDGKLEFHFCTDCGCLSFWKATQETEGRRRVAVNLRMADPKQVRDIPIKMFDGLTTMMPIVYSKECRVRDFGV